MQTVLKLYLELYYGTVTELCNEGSSVSLTYIVLTTDCIIASCDVYFCSQGIVIVCSFVIDQRLAFID